MTIFPTTNRWIEYKGHMLNVTIHMDGVNNVQYPALIEATVKLFVFVAGLIKAGKDTVEWPVKEPLTPEDRIAQKHNLELPPLVESRVVVWDKVFSLTVHSHDSAQGALDAYWAMEAGCKLLGVEKVETQPATPAPKQSAQTPAPQVAAGELPTVENAKAAKAHIGKTVIIPVAAVSKAFTPKGAAEYQLFGTYGGSLGKFPELRVYADNEAAINQGVVGLLDSLNLKPGDNPSTHPLQAKVKVAAKGDKVNLYVNELVSVADPEENSNAYRPQGFSDEPH